MGKLLGGSKTSRTTSEQSPWEPQIPYLTRGFTEAGNLLDSQINQPFFGGQTYAPLNATQQDAINRTIGYATGPGANMAQTFGNTASGLLGNAGQFSSNAASIYGRMLGDPTGQIINSAGQYANNPYLDSVIGAVAGDVNRNLNENTLQDLNLGAIAGGNLNSSRVGVAEGIARRGASEAIADASAGIRAGAYSQGLGLASDLYGTNLRGALSANDQLGNATSLGLNATPVAQNLNLSNLGALGAAGGQLQADQQGQYDDAFARWQMQNQQPWQALNNYWNIVGNNSYGGTSVGTTKQPSAGILQQGLGLASMALPLMGPAGFGMIGAGAAATPSLAASNALPWYATLPFMGSGR